MTTVFRPIGFNAQSGRGRDYCYPGNEFSAFLYPDSYDFIYLFTDYYEDKIFGEGVGDLCEDEDGYGSGYYTVSNRLR